MVRSADRVKRIFIFTLLIAGSLLLSACSQTVDVTFYTDRSWNLQSDISCEDQLAVEFQKYIPKIIEKLNLPIQPEINWSSTEESLVKSGLETLVAYYGSKSIDFRYSQLPSTKGLTYFQVEASGRDMASFKELLPQAVLLDEQAPEEYHMHVTLGDANMLSRGIYQQDIRFHARKVVNTNAPRLEESTATWPNPREIDVVFFPAARPIPTPVATSTSVPTPGLKVWGSQIIIDLEKDKIIPWMIGGLIVILVSGGLLYFGWRNGFFRNAGPNRKYPAGNRKGNPNIKVSKRSPGRMRGVTSPGRGKHPVRRN